MPTLDAQGATLHYEVCGGGRPGAGDSEGEPALVFVHGSGGNAMSWWQQVPHFAARHRVVCFDHRGFGRSHCIPDALEPGHFAADLASILDAARVERAALVCQSMGGWTGLAFALAHPQRCAALVLAGTPGGLFTPRVAADAAGIPQRSAERGFLGMALGAGFRTRDARGAFLYEQIGALNPPTTLPAVLPKLGDLRVEPARLADFRVPTLVIAGSEDAFFSPEALEEVAAAIPGARLEVVPGAGHSVYFEEPDRFNQLVDAFLKEIAPWASSS